MPNYLRHEAEDAARRRSADSERRADQQARQEHTNLERWRQAHDRRVTADAARRRRADEERSRRVF